MEVVLFIGKTGLPEAGGLPSQGVSASWAQSSHIWRVNRRGQGQGLEGSAVVHLRPNYVLMAFQN